MFLGFKVLSPTGAGKYMEYQEGCRYSMDNPPVLGRRGFSFCLTAGDAFNWNYRFDPENTAAYLVEINGQVVTNGKIGTTNDIAIVCKIPWDIMLEAAKGDLDGIKKTLEENKPGCGDLDDYLRFYRDLESEEEDEEQPYDDFDEDEETATMFDAIKANFLAFWDEISEEERNAYVSLFTPAEKEFFDKIMKDRE